MKKTFGIAFAATSAVYLSWPHFRRKLGYMIDALDDMLIEREAREAVADLLARAEASAASSAASRSPVSQRPAQC